jgi:hypothetical protein
VKITALIPDKLVDEVAAHAQGRNFTESLLIALREWLAQKKIARLNQRIKKTPLEFRKAFSAQNVRAQNRR